MIFSPDYDARMEICRECPAYNAGICNDCGCILAIKARLKGTSCPRKKWPGDKPATLVASTVSKARMKVCEVCPQRRGRTCKLCSCDITKLTKQKDATCPENRWPEEN